MSDGGYNWCTPDGPVGDWAIPEQPYPCPEIPPLEFYRDLHPELFARRPTPSTFRPDYATIFAAEDADLASLVDDIVRELDHKFAGRLPELPPGWQYRFDTTPLTDNPDGDDNYKITVTATPQKIIHTDD